MHANKLNSFLHSHYGGFADKRFKKLQLGRTIVVDQHRDGRKINQSIHCLIAITVREQEFEIVLWGNVPGMTGATKSIKRIYPIDTQLPTRVREIAVSISRVDHDEHHPSWYYSKKESVSDLERLAATLDRFFTEDSLPFKLEPQ